jgi:hypothetical protein
MAITPSDLLSLIPPDDMSDRDRAALFSELSEEEVRRSLVLAQLINAVVPRSGFHLRYERLATEALKAIQRRRASAYSNAKRLAAQQ